MTYEGKTKFLVLAAFCLLFFMLNAFTFNGLGVILPYMVEELGWNWTVAGLGFTFLGLSCGLSGLAPALLIRRFGVPRSMLGGGAVLLTGFTCLALTNGPLLYFTGTIFIGIGFSICGAVPGVSVISHSFKRSSTAVGIYYTSGGLGAVAGPLVAYASQALTSDWRAYWVCAALTAVVLSLFAALVTGNRMVPDTSTETEKREALKHGWSVRAAMRTPQYYVVVGAYTAFLLINTTVHGFAVQHLSEHGLSMGTAATVMSLIALISAGGSTAAGVAGEKIGPRELTIISLSATVIGVLALVIGGNMIAVSIAVIGLGIGFGFSYVSTTMLLLDFFGKRPNLELFSTMHMISTAAAIGPALGGMARDQLGNFSLVFVFCGALGFIFLAAMVWLQKPVLKKDADTTEECEPVLAA